MDTTLMGLAAECLLILTKCQPTDETRFPEKYFHKLLNKAREEAIDVDYKKEGILDQNWIQDLGMVTFHRVNFADDIRITSCTCDVSKATLPAFISLGVGHGNQDLGVNVMSACGKTKYYPMSLSLWSNIPCANDSELGMFKYYSRMNTVMYVNSLVTQLRVYGILQNPEDAIIVNSEPVSSGSIVSTVSYTVKYGQIIYNGSVYKKDETFTGGVVATFTGTGLVYKTSQITDFLESSPYPIGGGMARRIVQDVLVKEFGLERQQVADVQNDSRDDATKQGKV